MNTLVEFKNITKKFPKYELEVLKNIDIKIKEKEFCCFVGPSGCGKSTLLSMIAGFEEPSTGSLIFDGNTIQKPGPDRAVVFQEASLFPWMTVLENVEMGLKIKGLDKVKRREKAKHYLKLVGLNGFENHLPAELSGGMKQRVSIARVLVLEPKMLLMDEPFGALDAQTRSQMHELLTELWENIQCSVMFITHDIEEALLLGDSVYIISSRPGSIVKKIDVDLERPRNKLITTTPSFNNLKAEIINLLG